jgi:TatD DNase family protein
MLDDAAGALAEARAAGVGTVVAVGIDVASSRAAVELAQRTPGVYATVGLHPHDAGRLDDGLLAELAGLATSKKVVAVGECGLDYYRDRAPREAQERAFVVQIQLARRVRLPLVVHVRDAGEDALRLLAEHAQGLRVILHCFSQATAVEECNACGYFQSYAGNMTYASAADLRGAAARTREDLLLVETDAPFLTPVPLRGKPNRPALVKHTASALADVRGWDMAQAAAVTTANARRAFAFDEVGA